MELIFINTVDQRQYTSNFYTTPVSSGVVSFQSLNDFAKDITGGAPSGLPSSVKITDSASNVIYGCERYSELIGNWQEWYIKETINNVSTTQTIRTIPPDELLNYIVYNGNKSIELGNGTYNLEYEFYGNVAGYVGYHFVMTAILGVVDNRKPLKKWTITDCFNRIFDCIEPLKYGQKPKFRLEGVIYEELSGNASGYYLNTTAHKLDKIIAPEFNLSKMTLREQLKTVCGYIHAEPKITYQGNDTNGDIYYTIGFDFYGAEEVSKIKNIPPISATRGININEFCTSLDSAVDNLINQLDWAVGVVTEPFVNGEKSLRSETTTARLSDNENSLISTQEPIYQVKKLVCKAIYDNSATPITGEWDLTPFLFESADYENLSSYKGTYPFSKSYALYYTQGQKNIKGLFFKPATATALGQVLTEYSIINILEAVTGQTLSVSGNYYYKLAFEITYLPLIKTRVSTNKSIVIGNEKRAITYNQNANIVEGRYYGSLLQGVVARMGNIEKTYTYNLAFLTDIPKVGTLFDEHYYISTVSTEFLPSYIKCTIGLSKDFNRLSQYVGISSNKRMYEISEKQAFDRENLNTNYVLITDKDYKVSDQNVLVRPDIIANVLFNKTISTPNGKITSPITAVQFDAYSKKRTRTQPNYSIVLPVTSTALGNSMLFGYRLADNYSAGQKIEYVNDSGDMSGFWGVRIPYGDYYGRFFYYTQKLIANTNELQISIDGEAERLPQSGNVVGGFYLTGNIEDTDKIKFRKDSRETPSFTYELSMVTDIENLVIGSALAKNCALVNQSPEEYLLVGFNKRVNTLSSRVECSVEDNEITVKDGVIIDTSISFNGDNIVIPDIGSQYKAWAIITTPTIRTIEVEDEDGAETTQSVQVGGEIVLAYNNYEGGSKRLYFVVKQDVYKQPAFYTLTVKVNSPNGEQTLYFTQEGEQTIAFEGGINDVLVNAPVGVNLTALPIGGNLVITYSGSIKDQASAIITVV